MVRDVPTASVLAAGLSGRCPRCGRGALFRRGLVLRDKCEDCGLSYAFADSGDGPAVFAIFILGFLILGGALLVEFKLASAGVGARRAVGDTHAPAGVLPAARPQGDADRPAVQAQGRAGPVRAGLSERMLAAPQTSGPDLADDAQHRRSRRADRARHLATAAQALEGRPDRQDRRARRRRSRAAFPRRADLARRRRCRVSARHRQGPPAHDKERYLYAPAKSGPGWHVYAPLEWAPRRSSGSIAASFPTSARTRPADARVSRPARSR